MFFSEQSDASDLDLEHNNSLIDIVECKEENNVVDADLSEKSDDEPLCEPQPQDLFGDQKEKEESQTILEPSKSSKKYKVIKTKH